MHPWAHSSQGRCDLPGVPQRRLWQSQVALSLCSEAWAAGGTWGQQPQSCGGAEGQRREASKRRTLRLCRLSSAEERFFSPPSLVPPLICLGQLRAGLQPPQVAAGISGQASLASGSSSGAALRKNAADIARNYLPTHKARGGRVQTMEKWAETAGPAGLGWAHCGCGEPWGQEGGGGPASTCLLGAPAQASPLCAADLPTIKRAGWAGCSREPAA